MAIGTTAAVLGSAVIGGVGSAVASSNNKKAINRATDAQTESNAQSVALQRDVFNQNKATLNPYVSRGNAAGDSINALLGLGGGQQQANALSQFGAGAPYGLGDGVVRGYDGQTVTRPDLSYRYGQTGSLSPSQTYGVNLPSQGGPVNAQSGALSGQSAQGAANDAFDIFRGSTGYQFRLNEGLDAVNSGYAGAGTLQSGAALKAINEYGQNFASNEFGNYMGYLGQQQGTGLQAAGAQAGVGVNYANNVSNLNQQNANALSNAAVANANNNNALIGSLGGLAGGILGGL